MKAAVETLEPEQRINIMRYTLADDGTFPNNGLLQLLVYKKVFLPHTAPDDQLVKDTFESNNWSNAWTDGIFDYHHYHSITHEVLGIVAGSASVQFGGPKGVSILLEQGDVVIIPAGVAHKKIESTDDFSCVGAYPDGKDYDIKEGKENERPEADENIRKVPLPEMDPVYGAGGPLLKNWSATTDRSHESIL